MASYGASSTYVRPKRQPHYVNNVINTIYDLEMSIMQDYETDAGLIIASRMRSYRMLCRFVLAVFISDKSTNRQIDK